MEFDLRQRHHQLKKSLSLWANIDKHGTWMFFNHHNNQRNWGISNWFCNITDMCKSLICLQNIFSNDHQQFVCQRDSLIDLGLQNGMCWVSERSQALSFHREHLALLCSSPLGDRNVTPLVVPNKLCIEVKLWCQCKQFLHGYKTLLVLLLPSFQAAWESTTVPQRHSPVEANKITLRPCQSILVFLNQSFPAILVSHVLRISAIRQKARSVIKCVFFS